jgi:hypothetical protein
MAEFVAMNRLLRIFNDPEFCELLGPVHNPTLIVGSDPESKCNVSQILKPSTVYYNNVIK